MKTKPEKTTPAAKAQKIAELQSQLTYMKARQEAAKKRVLGTREAHKRAKRAFKLAKRDAKAVRKKVKAAKRAVDDAMVAGIVPRSIAAKKPRKAKKLIRASKPRAVVRPAPTVVAAPPPV